MHRDTYISRGCGYPIRSREINEARSCHTRTRTPRALEDHIARVARFTARVNLAVARHADDP